MSFKIEDLEAKNMKKLVIEVSEEKFAEAYEKAYQKNKNKINVQGFRKGKAPKALIEKLYGPAVFYEEAANLLIPDAYEEAAKESGLAIVSQPVIDVEQIEKGKSFIFTAEFAVKPEVTLGQYKGVEVAKVDTTVSDEDVAAEIDKAREQNSRTISVEDRAVQNGDIVNINYLGTVDGVAFEGGQAEGYELTIGSHSFIDTFEDQIIGKNIGDEFDVNVTFPEQYHAADLAGKPAVFAVKVNGIKAKELPELNDEFASEVSEFETLDEYKADVKKNLEENKVKLAKDAKRDEALDKIIEASEMDIPAPMVEQQKRQMIEGFAQRLQMQGLSFEQYMQFTGMTPDKFMETMTPQATKDIQTRLVLEAIVKAENIEISAEELDAEYAAMAAQYNMEVEKIKEILGEAEAESIKLDLAVRKAADIIADTAVEK